MSTNHAALALTANPELALLLSLAGLATATLAGLGLAAFLRRQSRSYLLVALALLALFARTVVAIAAMAGFLGDGSHHVFEHGLDTVMAALVVAAVYYARSVEGTPSMAGGGNDD